MPESNTLRPSLDDGLLIEGVVTSTNPDGATNTAPMGLIVDADWRRVLLRPYQPSRTFDNVTRTGRCVLNITDDVELIAAAALGELPPDRPALSPTPCGRGRYLADACRWYSLEVVSVDDSRQRSEILCRVADSGRLRDFVGFNRAKHAVIEAAILATRVGLLGRGAVRQQIAALAPAVEKTGGPAERRAFARIQAQIAASTRPLCAE